MQIINDFFLLIWEEDAKRLFTSKGDTTGYLESILKKNYDSFCDYASIMLIVCSDNMDQFGKIEEANDALNFLAGIDDWDKKSVQYIQKELIAFLQYRGNLKLNKNIQKRFDKLRVEGVVGYEKTRKLISLISLIEEKIEIIAPIVVEKAKEGSNFFESALNLFITSVENLKNSVEDEALHVRLDAIPPRLKNQKFSIGITGVMNAGKSTMLNALLGKEILGTSVIPETANLTLIKYAENPSAKVNFWNKEEWASIVKSADILENMKPFVKETNEYFKNNLDEYVSVEGNSYEIGLDELPSYTSAEHSGKKCNLVKSVELYTDLKFVKSGVEIVDTPGLDDPVIQREEITKSYVSQCDLMMHLMNVNQSATEKDIEFIVDTLLYQNVARLLVVITRIDTVEKSELDEVIKYTKSSIKSKLESLNKQNTLDSILEKIDFIPIAGLKALQHRLGNPDTNYPLEKTGVLEIEAYLEDVLFGSNSQKAQLIVDSNKKEINHIINATCKSFEVEKNLLSKSSSEIKNEQAKYADEISQIRTKIETLKVKINEERDDLIGYFTTLENFSKNRFVALQAVVLRRVMDDVSYELEKNKKKPDENRVKYIVETAIKDGFIDILREYRYQFSKKIESAFEKLERDFEDFNQDERKKGDAKEFFEKHFSDLNLVNSNAVLITSVNSAIKSSSKKDLEALSVKLNDSFTVSFEELYKKFKEKSSKINVDLVDEFEIECKNPLQSVEFEMNTKEELLNIAKVRIEDKSFDTQARLNQIETKLSLIKKVNEELK